MQTGQTELFLKLEEELKNYKKAIGQASDMILSQEISEKPIFIVHQQTVNLGIPIIDRNKVNGNWSVNASTLEEFIEKGLLRSDKLTDFITVYKDPKEFLCLFVLSELGATFIFLPRFETQA